MYPLTRPSRLRFAGFELDASACELRKNGTLLRLQPQPCRVLQLLAENSGTVVTREEIRKHLWSDSTFVDFEHGINFSIKQIRAALSDDANKPRYIETLPKRGYRFLVAVEITGNSNGASSVAKASPDNSFQGALAPREFADTLQPTGPHGDFSGNSRPLRALRVLPATRLGRWSAMAAIIALVLVGGFTVPTLLFPSAPRVSRIQQLTQSGRAEPWGEIATDGSRLFYLEREGDHWRTMQVAAIGGETQPFPVPFPNTVVFSVSPDRSQMLVAPFVQRTGNLPLWIMPLVGGQPRRVGDLQVSAASFSSDGASLAFANSDGISVSDLQGGNSRTLAALPGVNTNVVWSPRGDILRFTHSDPSSWVPTLYEVGLNGRNLHAVFPNWSYGDGQCCGRWTPDGSYYIFQSWHGYENDLWAIKESQFPAFWIRPKPTLLTFGPLSFINPFPGPSGHVVYAHGAQWRFQVFTINPQNGQTKELLPGTEAQNAFFSPDKQWLLYTTFDGMWRSRPDGTARLQLAPNSGRELIFDPRWRPDSKFVLYYHRLPKGTTQMLLVPADGGPHRSLLDSDHAYERPDWSPDGKSILYSLIDDTPPTPVSDTGVYILNLDSGQKTKLPGSEQLSQARWSPDGRFVAALSPDGSALRLYDFSRKSWSTVAQGKLISVPVWSPDSQYLYFQDILQPGEQLSRYRLSDSSIEPVFRFDALLKTVATRCAFIGFAPDGSLVVQVNGAGTNLYKLELDLP